MDEQRCDFLVRIDLHEIRIAQNYGKHYLYMTQRRSPNYQNVRNELQIIFFYSNYRFEVFSDRSLRFVIFKEFFYSNLILTPSTIHLS